MKVKAKFTIVLGLFFVSAILHAQVSKTVDKHNEFKNTKEGIQLIEYVENFDGDSLVYNPYCILTIDSTLPSNIWQIGQPQKALFDSAYTPPNALVTDTINPYPINNYSSFEIALKKPEWAEEFCWSYLSLSFTYRMETDTLQDGWYVEISYDGGANWNNILFDTVPDNIIAGNLYSLNSILYNGMAGFSGSSHLWSNDMIPWTSASVNYSWNDSNAYTIDSCRFRIVFISDSIDSQKDGLLIDHISISVWHLCGIGVNEFSRVGNGINIYPVPVNKQSVLDIPDYSGQDIIKLEIYDITGKIVYCNTFKQNPVPLENIQLDNGMYILKIFVGEKSYSLKTLFQNE
ncbi:MAG: T9SS type A sorting domain-containing protein [Bacteroidales bacterium]|nr:T9SS type A sorting domain-containing protein [Bacteroidales bacterium]MCF8458056.1 T9SS type A sorting domain-containing protein [Bacteroidales bacterium]